MARHSDILKVGWKEGEAGGISQSSVSLSCGSTLIGGVKQVGHGWQVHADLRYLKGMPQLMVADRLAGQAWLSRYIRMRDPSIQRAVGVERSSVETMA